MLDQKSYVNFIKKIQEFETVEDGINNEIKKLMYDIPNISFDKYKELAFDILETAMGDIDRDTTQWIYETNYGRDIEKKYLKEYGLENIKSLEELYDYVTLKRNTRKIFVISDTHFNHKNVIEYCDRPYNSVKEMNKDIIKKWNSVVKPNDLVIHLGDFGFGNRIELSNIVNQLNGTKYLILGNHDYRFGKNYFEKIGFKKVYKEFVLANIIFSHYPKEVKKGQINIYGHIHNSNPAEWYDDKDHFCACVEMINYTPIGLSEILRGIIYE